MRKEADTVPPASAQSPAPAATPDRAAEPFPLSFVEFVALIAALMACNALSIDAMLPALPAIGRDLAVTEPNHRQWIIILYFLGMAVGSLLYGTLSDRFGRRPVLLTCIGLFMGATLFCALAQSFTVLLIGRAAAGFFAAGSRVITLSVIRDRFEGDRMASVMSLIFLVFIMVPIIAPTLGQAVLYIAGWRWIFGMLLGIAALTMLWMAIRLPETMARHHRIEIRVADLAATVRSVVGHRGSMGYMAAAGLVAANMVAFISSVQQIFTDVFAAGAIFPYLFACLAGAIGFGSICNSRLVQRIGARRLSQGSLIAMALIGAVHAATGLTGRETIWSFCVLQGATMLCVALTTSNFSAISMEPFARGAGLAASFQAFTTTMISALLGAVIGGAFNGTTVPLALGTCGCALGALALVAYGERGKLFTRPGRYRSGLPGQI